MSSTAALCCDHCIDVSQATHMAVVLHMSIYWPLLTLVLHSVLITGLSPALKYTVCFIADCADVLDDWNWLYQCSALALLQSYFR